MLSALSKKPASEETATDISNFVPKSDDITSPKPSKEEHKGFKVTDFEETTPVQNDFSDSLKSNAVVPVINITETRQTKKVEKERLYLLLEILQNNFKHKIDSDDIAQLKSVAIDIPNTGQLENNQKERLYLLLESLQKNLKNRFSNESNLKYKKILH